MVPPSTPDPNLGLTSNLALSQDNYPTLASAKNKRQQPDSDDENNISTVFKPVDPGVASSIPVQSHTFVEIDHEMISTVILLLPLIHSRRVVVSYKRKYVHELLVNRLFKPAQEKVWLGELTVPQ